ncbi:hypothetical protein SDC9_123493 [bioreactor metagenome]|uniref:Uncharacterized protein n=1 Tax=bioreactor metagenome TaxID=1076179 RepID=A0A645CHT6_9ZZZZ
MPGFGGDRVAAQAGQRLQGIATAGQGADQQGCAGEQHDDADAFPETLPTLGMRRQRVEGVQVDSRHDEQQRPGEHAGDRRHDRRDQPDGSGQQQHAESLLDAFHPRPGLGQQGTAGDADGDQRGPHAQRHDEQRRAAEYGIAGLADVEQGPGERRGDAGTDDQRRQRAHQEDADAAPALQVAGFFRKFALQRGR